MPFKILVPATMSTDFKQTVCEEGGIGTFSLYKKGGERESLSEQNKYELQES